MLKKLFSRKKKQEPCKGKVYRGIRKQVMEETLEGLKEIRAILEKQKQVA